MAGRGSLSRRPWEFTGGGSVGQPGTIMKKQVLGASAPGGAMRGHRDCHGRDFLADAGDRGSDGLTADSSWGHQQKSFLLQMKDAPVKIEAVDDDDGVPLDSEETLNNDAGDSVHRQQQQEDEEVSPTKTWDHRPAARRTPKKRPAKKRREVADPSVLHERKQPDINSDSSIDLDMSVIPVPICSCTGVARQCYRWGSLGWQSSCCTTNVSQYPLPMSMTRPSTRIAGRKMSIGVYKKLLRRLAAEGQDIAAASVDLKGHWARHGTNKFVTIR